MKKPNLSIVIVNWNTKEILKDCIDSIFKNRGGVDLETIIIDNGSSDGSSEKIEELIKKYPAIRIKLVRNKENLGFSKANNQAIRIAKGRYILLLNSDTILKKDSLEKLISYLEKNENVAAVSPMLFNPDGTKQVDYYMKFPNIFQILFYHNPVLRPVVMKTPLKDLIISKTSNKPFEVDQLPGAAILTTKTIFSKTKGLNDEYFFLFEDVDWCYRVKEKRLGKLVVVPASKIIHLGGVSWKKKLDNSRYDFYKQYFSSLLLFIKKNYKTKSLFIIALMFTFLVNGLVSLILLRTSKSIVQFKLLIWSFSNIWDK